MMGGRMAFTYGINGGAEAAAAGGALFASAPVVVTEVRSVCARALG